VKITVGVTDAAWAAYLRTRPDIYEVNFWVPSGVPFTGRASPDEPFLFKTKVPDSQLVGGGFFVHFWLLRVSEAWATFGEGNGCGSEEALSTAIQQYRAKNRAPQEPDPTIGCVVLRNPFFAQLGDELPQPEHWGNSIVKGKTYDEDDPDYGYVKHVFQTFQGEARVDLTGWDEDLVGVDIEGLRYGQPVLTRHRLGQGSFRLAVLDAYDGRCAITGSTALPALEAAHIRDYARGGAALGGERSGTSV
jgi:putative restriction endonuclease